jgi:hypothetical protein
MCFNKPLGGDKRGDGTEYDKLSPLEIGQVMDDTFWLYYLFCLGCGINKMKGPLLQAQAKEICCQGAAGLEGVSTEGVFCSQMATALCIWQECRLPPSPGNPKCAICTWKMNKDHSAA